MWWLLLAGAWACEHGATTPQLEGALGRADQAFVAADLEAFKLSVSEARGLVICLEEVVPVPLVAELHRTEGLAAFFEQATEKSGQAFAAARRLDPLYRFPAAVVPAGNPLHDAYASVDPASAGALSLDTPAEGSLRVDGRRGQTRSLMVPSLFQRLSAEGQVVDTAYLWPADPAPAYPVYVAPPEPEAPPPSASVKVPLRWGAGAALVASGLLYGAAGLTHLQYDSASTPADQLDGLRVANNGLVIAAGGTLAVGLGLGTVSFVID